MRMKRGHFFHGLSELIVARISGEPSPNKNVAWVVASIFVKRYSSNTVSEAVHERLVIIRLLESRKNNMVIAVVKFITGDRSQYP